MDLHARLSSRYKTMLERTCMMDMLEIAQVSSLRLTYSSSEARGGPPVRTSGTSTTSRQTYGEAQ
jgi:hypothetical protein